MLDFCRQHGIVLLAFAALGHAAEPRLLDDPVIVAIARRLGKTTAQVALAWAIQRGTALLTTSVTPSRIQENFELSAMPADAMQDIQIKIAAEVRFNSVVEPACRDSFPGALISAIDTGMRRDPSRKPSKYEPDILAKGLDVVFCGLNPASSAAADGHNFSNRSNRFWLVLHLAGFTDVRLEPQEECRLLDYGCGITAVVRRATAKASRVSPENSNPGPARLRDQDARLPRTLAFLGKRALSAMTSWPIWTGADSLWRCRHDGLGSSQSRRSQQGFSI